MIDDDDTDTEIATAESTGATANLRGRAASETVADEHADSNKARPCFTRAHNPLAALAWVRGRYGEEGVENVVATLDKRDRAALHGGQLNAHAWVPFLAHAHLLEHIDAVYGEGDLRLLRTVGRFMGLRDFPSVSRPFLRLLRPGFFIDKGMRLWRFYHSSGRWQVTRGKNEILATLTDHSEHHVAFCAALVGWVEGALSLTGAREPQGRELRCAARGDDRCTFALTWLS